MFIEEAIKFYKMYGGVLNRKTTTLKIGVFLGNRLFNGSYDKYHSYILKILSKQFKDVIDKYKNINVVPKENNSKDIWMCWFQGYENMPPVVKRCYEATCNNFSDYNVHLITCDNFADYVEIPQTILDKFNKGMITKTHFSDILRVKLLRKYGGFWIDSTLFSTSSKPLPKDSFTTIKMRGGGFVYRIIDGVHSF